MHAKVNAYLAIFFITVLGAGAALIIIRMADTDSVGAQNTDRASYAELQNSILGTSTPQQ